MGDFIKELNIIDFLGIGIPGCVLVLLLTGDEVGLQLWETVFGTTYGEITHGLLLAIGGYIAGMLVQEIGDLVEKGMWCCPLLDPKTYAAHAVGENRIKEIINDKDIEANSMINETLKFIAGIISMGAVLFSAVFFLNKVIQNTCAMISEIEITENLLQISTHGFTPVVACVIAAVFFYCVLHTQK